MSHNFFKRKKTPVFQSRGARLAYDSKVEEEDPESAPPLREPMSLSKGVMILKLGCSILALLGLYYIYNASFRNLVGARIFTLGEEEMLWMRLARNLASGL